MEGRRVLVAVSAAVLVFATLAFGVQSSATALAEEPVNCTRVLGGSQTTDWYSNGDFESLVVARDWERQSRGGQYITSWDIGASGWNTRVWSACGQDALNGTPFLPVTHVMLHALPPHGTPSVGDVIQQLNGAIEGIRLELPDAIDITLMPPVGGDCPGVGLADVNPTVVAAINAIAGGDLYAGPNVIVPDCSMFSDNAGHLTLAGSDWVAEQVAAWFATGDSAPVADAGPDQTVDLAEGATTADVVLDGSGSTDDGTIVDYQWSENSNQIATGATPTVAFTAGVHTVTLAVTDDTAQTDTDTVQITVNVAASTAPVADAGPDQTVDLAEGATTADVVLDGSGSTDDGTIVAYRWSENSSQIATGATPTVAFTAGVHTVTLAVTDDTAQTDTDTVQITVNEAASTAPVADAGADQTVDLAEGATTADVVLDGSGSTDDGTIVAYQWSENSSQIATGPTPTVAFTAGVHTVTLTVTDDTAQTDTDTVQITVNPPSSGLVYVADLDGVGSRVGKSWVAAVTVTVLSGGQPVAGATVDGTWAGGTGAASCVTDGSGDCTVTSDQLDRHTETLDFTVTNVSAAELTYDPGSNADPDGDSNGTTITVLRP